MSLVESQEIWLGSVSSDWHRSRIRNVAELSPTFSGDPPSPDEICTVLAMEKISEDGMVDFTDQQEFQDISSGLTFSEAGDVLFAKITPCMENGKGAYVQDLPTRYAFGSTEFHVLRPRKHVDGKFLYYYTFNPTYRAYAAENMTGAAGQKRVSSRFLKDTRLVLPTLAEQQRIAAYLDASCKAIDAAVAAKKQQLKMLDAMQKALLLTATTGLQGNIETTSTRSSVIPRIPIGWKLARLKSVASIRYGLGQPPEELDTGVPMIRATDVDAGIIKTDNFLHVNPDDLPTGRDPYLKEGEIIVVRSGAYTGDSAIIPKSLEGAVAGYDMVVTVTHASPRFVAYCLLSRHVLEDQLLLLTLRAAQPHLNAQELGSISLALPPTVEEQEKVADFLDERLNEVKCIASGIKAQIEILNNYRKSLIHECVTGQRRITEVDLVRAQSHG